MFENFKDNWKTTLVGFIAVIIPVIIVIGWLTPEQGEELTEQTNVLMEAIEAIIGAIVGIVLMFGAKDG